MEEFGRQIIVMVFNGAILALAGVLVWKTNQWWGEHAKKLNDDWADRCKKQNEEWATRCREIIDEQKKTLKEINDARQTELDQAHDSWSKAFKKTMDYVEDRYFRYTKQVVELRDSTRKS